MKPYLAAALWAGFAAVPAAVDAQTPVPPAAAAHSDDTRDFPPPVTKDGRPIESRPPEKNDDKPAFPEQTRAPYHASAPF